MSEKALEPLDPSKPLELSVQVSDRVVSAKEAIDAFRSQGLVDIKESAIRDLEAIGIHVKTVGMLKIQRGRVMVQQQWISVVLSQIVSLLTKIAQDDKDKKKVDKIARLGATMSELCRRDTDAARLAVEIEGLVAPGGGPPEEPEPENKGFVVGQPVRARAGGTTIVARDVHVHQNGGQKQ